MNKPYVRLLVLALLLIMAWVLWSGYLKPLLLGLGALSCALTIWIMRRMGYFDDETFAFHYDWRLLGFWAWLGGEIIKSSIEVARVVLRRRMDVEPRIVNVDGSGLEPLDLALLGNSITLTPGTLTLDVHNDRLLVHALTADGAAALQGGEMQRRVAALRKR
jgi:multicomponent Na+:H+ antiporter subunit E